MQRIAPKFGRLSNVPTVASVDSMSPNDLSSTIRQIVREELLRCQQVSHCSSAFQDGYARETAHTRTPAAPALWQPSVNVADVDECQGTLQSLEYSDRTPSYYERRFRSPRFTQRTSAGYRPHEERYCYPMPSDRTGHSELPRVSRPPPVCYSCGVPGHISRYCNNPPTYQRDPLLMSPQPFDRPFSTPRPPRAPTSLRYPSPASDRSLTPPPDPRARRSPSPRRRTQPMGVRPTRPMGVRPQDTRHFRQIYPRQCLC